MRIYVIPEHYCYALYGHKVQLKMFANPVIKPAYILM